MKQVGTGFVLTFLRYRLLKELEMEVLKPAPRSLLCIDCGHGLWAVEAVVL